MTLLLEGVTVVAVLSVVIAGSQLPSGLVLARLTPDVVLIAALWVIGLLLVQRAGKACRGMKAGMRPIRALTRNDIVAENPIRR